MTCRVWLLVLLYMFLLGIMITWLSGHLRSSLMRDYRFNKEKYFVAFYQSAFTSPRFTSPRFTSPRFTSPRFTSPRFTNPVQSSPVQSSPVQSSPVQSSPVQSSRRDTVCQQLWDIFSLVKKWKKIGLSSIDILICLTVFKYRYFPQFSPLVCNCIIKDFSLTVFTF